MFAWQNKSVSVTGAHSWSVCVAPLTQAYYPPSGAPHHPPVPPLHILGSTQSSDERGARAALLSQAPASTALTLGATVSQRHRRPGITEIIIKISVQRDNRGRNIESDPLFNCVKPLFW